MRMLSVTSQSRLRLHGCEDTCSASHLQARLDVMRLVRPLTCAEPDAHWPCMGVKIPTLLAPTAAAAHASLELGNLLGDLLRLLRGHRLIDDAQELLLVLIDQRQQLRILLAQFLQQSLPSNSCHGLSISTIS